MNRLRTLMSAVLLTAGLLAAGCDAPSPAASTQAITPAPGDLEARIKALEALLPSQSHLMADVGDHFANLWFAGRAANWPLADFYLAETKSHLRWAVRRIPVRKDNKGREVNLTGILEAFENSQLAQLKRAIDARDGSAFERTYKEGLTMCYSCHKAADKAYLRPRVPAEPPSRIINFDPKADWPL
jgi:cytochrome c553